MCTGSEELGTAPVVGVVWCVIQGWRETGGV